MLRTLISQAQRRKAMQAALIRNQRRVALANIIAKDPDGGLLIHVIIEQAGA